MGHLEGQTLGCHQNCQGNKYMGSTTHHSVFAQMGYEIVGYRGGAYHLQQRGLKGELTFDGVGLLFSSRPIHEVALIEFFEMNGLDSATGSWMPGRDITGLLDQWGLMDARRLGESGLYSVSLHLADITASPIQRDNQTVPRPAPEEYRQRHYSIIGTGDVVCYN